MFQLPVASELTKTSIFPSVDEASEFFAKGAVGYSLSKDERTADAGNATRVASHSCYSRRLNCGRIGLKL